MRWAAPLSSRCPHRCCRPRRPSRLPARATPCQVGALGGACHCCSRHCCLRSPACRPRALCSTRSHGEPGSGERGRACAVPAAAVSADQHPGYAHSVQAAGTCRCDLAALVGLHALAHSGQGRTHAARQPQALSCQGIPLAPQGTQHERELAAGGTRALRWADVLRPLRLCVRVQEAGWMWSGGFELDSPGDLFIKIRCGGAGAT